MINRLFTLRSERQVDTGTQVTPDLFDDRDFAVKKPDYSTSYFTADEREFFGLPKREEGGFSNTTVVSPMENDAPPNKKKTVAAVIAVAATFGAALVWGVQGELDTERRREKLESCMNNNLEPDSQIELVIDGQRGTVVIPPELEALANKCG